MVQLKTSDFPQSVCKLPGFVSNGYWAIRETNIKNAPMFATEETVRAFGVNRFGNIDNLSALRLDETRAPYRFTGLVLVSGKTEVCIYVRESDAEYVQLSRKLLATVAKACGSFESIPEVLFGAPEGKDTDALPLSNCEDAESGAFVLMPHGRIENPYLAEKAVRS